MSEKDSLSRRGFFESLLPHTDSQASEPKSDKQESRPASSTDRRGFISASVVSVGLLYSELAQAGRFDILELIDPIKPANFANDQDPYSALPKTDMQPYLWPSDDVRNKDMDPKSKMDIPSPSTSFDTMKRLQFIVNNRYKEIKDRLKCITYIKRNSNNFEHARNPQHPLHERHKKLKEVYDAEFPVNSPLLIQWEAIVKRMESLRKKIKESVMYEAQACKSLKRCAVEQEDIDQNDLFQAIPIDPIYSNPNLRNYTMDDENAERAQPLLPSQFKFEPFRCAKVDLTPGKEDTTNSYILECAKFLEKVVTAHLAAVKGREEDYLQIEKFSTEIVDKKAIAILRKIYTSGRKFNENARKKWTVILTEVMDAKALIAKAESDQSQAADVIKRCEKK